MKEPQLLIGQLSDAEIAKLKADHKTGIYFIKNATDIAYFREPVIHDVEAAFAVASDEKPFAAIRKFGELTIVGSCPCLSRVVSFNKLKLQSIGIIK